MFVPSSWLHISIGSDSSERLLRSNCSLAMVKRMSWAELSRSGFSSWTIWRYSRHVRSCSYISCILKEVLFPTVAGWFKTGPLCVITFVNVLFCKVLIFTVNCKCETARIEFLTNFYFSDMYGLSQRVVDFESCKNTKNLENKECTKNKTLVVTKMSNGVISEDIKTTFCFVYFSCRILLHCHRCLWENWPLK